MAEENEAGNTIKIGDAEIVIPEGADVIYSGGANPEPIGIFYPADTDTKGVQA